MCNKLVGRAVPDADLDRAVNELLGRANLVAHSNKA